MVTCRPIGKFQLNTFTTNNNDIKSQKGPNWLTGSSHFLYPLSTAADSLASVCECSCEPSIIRILRRASLALHAPLMGGFRAAPAKRDDRWRKKASIHLKNMALKDQTTYLLLELIPTATPLSPTKWTSGLHSDPSWILTTVCILMAVDISSIKLTPPLRLF